MKEKEKTERIPVLGIGFDSCTEEEAAEIILGKISSRKGPFTVYTPNPLIVMKARKNPEYADILRRAGLSLADGIGIVRKARRLGTPLPGRCTGIGTAEKVISGLSASGGTLYILGGAPGRAEKACENLSRTYPGICIAGFRDGYFSDDEENGICRDISEKNPDLLCICLGAVKQESFADRNLSSLHCGALMCIGGSADVWSGHVKRAPAFFRKTGLEWLYRMFREPRRFRDLFTLIRFCFAKQG